MSKLSHFFRLSIGQRILVGFALLLCIHLFVSLFSIIKINDFRELFSHYKHVSEDTNLMLKIESGVLELQRQILVFSDSKGSGHSTQLDASYQELISDINLLTTHDSSFADEEIQLLHRAIKTAIENFREKIDSLKERRDFRERRREYLSDLYNQLYIEFGSFKENSYRNQTIENLLWKAQLAISRSETIGSQYFYTHEYQLRKQVSDNLKNAVLLFNQAERGLTNASDKDFMIPIESKLAEIQKTFFQAVQADRDYLFLVNVVIAGEAAEFRTLANKLKQKSIENQTALYLDTEETLSQNQRFAIYSAVFSIVFALIIALVIGRGIAKALGSITNTFSDLASGKSLPDIPGMQRHDEIGRLANAANVFRKTNERTQQLLAETNLLANNLKARELELQKSVDELDNFAYVASHDLKSPLRAIHNLAEWIEEDCEEILPAESKDHLKKLQSRVQRMENLLADLLRYARVGRIEAPVEKTSVLKIIENSIEIIDKPNDFQFHIPEDLPEILTRVPPLQQIFQNLFSNAVKYNDKVVGEVRVEWKDVENNYIQFTVSDNGPGISAEFHERIFLMFQTLQPRDIIEASGMGLAMVKKVIEAEGGSIHVESEPGEGTSFIFTWPRTIQ